jgi:type I restriction enzyme S subunit
MNISTYKEYKDSGLDWLEKIPEDWEIIRVKDIAAVFNGGTPSSSHDEYWGGTINWITPEDISQNVLLTDSKRKITELGYASCGTSLVPPNSIILTTRAPIGNLSINKVEVCTNQGCRSLVVKDVFYKFLYYSLLARKSELQALGSGTTFFELSTSALKGFRLSLPPLPVQISIVNSLDEETVHINKRIDLLQAKKEKYRELRKTIINETVTRGLDKAVELKDSGVDWIGKIPKHWKVKRNKELFFESSKKSETGEEELLTVSHITGVTPRSEKNVNMFFAESMEGYKICKAGDLLVNTMWAWMGALGTSDYEGICSPSYGVYRVKKGIPYNHKYFDYLYRTSNFIVEMTRYSKGIVSSRLRLYSTEFFQLQTPVPPVQEQMEIANYLDEQTEKIDAIIAKIDDNIVVLNELRRTLINDAVTGKIKIS